MKIRLALLFLVLICCSGFTRTFAAEKQWYVDLGGKTLEAANDTYGSAGLRIGRAESNFKWGMAVYTLVDKSIPDTSNYQLLKRYEFAGLYTEYSQYYGRHLMMGLGLLSGAAYTEFQQKDADLIAVNEAFHFSIEPGLGAAVMLLDRFWLNVAASYLFTPSKDVLTSGPVLNIHARYMW